MAGGSGEIWIFFWQFEGRRIQITTHTHRKKNKVWRGARDFRNLKVYFGKFIEPGAPNALPDTPLPEALCRKTQGLSVFFSVIF